MAKIILSIGLFFLITITGFGQKLNSDGYKITLKDAEKKVMRFHSKIYITYKGTLKVSSRDSLKGTYHFVYLDLGEEASNLSFKDSEKKALPTKLILNKKTSTYSYNKKTGQEGIVKIKEGLPLEELVLEGMLIWLKIKNETL